MEQQSYFPDIEYSVFNRTNVVEFWNSQNWKYLYNLKNFLKIEFHSKTYQNIRDSFNKFNSEILVLKITNPTISGNAYGSYGLLYSIKLLIQVWILIQLVNKTQ